MATIRIAFDGGNVPIVIGDTPPDAATPIAEPTQTGFSTNQPFIVAEGVYCFGLDTAVRHTPLWQVVQAIDDEQSDVAFRRLP